MKHFAIILILAVVPAAHAQHLAVESAKLDVVEAPLLGAGETEVEFGYQFSYGEAENHPAAPVHAHSAGTVRLGAAYGITDAVDICASICWCEMQEHSTQSYAGSGLGDLEVGVKWQFADGTHHALTLSTMLQSPLGLTFGGGGLVPGSGSWSVTPALLAGVTYGRLSTGANVALVFPVDDPLRSPMQMTAIAVGWQLTEALQPVVEASLAGGIWDRESTSALGAGAMFSLPNGLRLTAGIRHVLAGDGIAEQGGFFRMTSAL